MYFFPSSPEVMTCDPFIILNDKLHHLIVKQMSFTLWAKAAKIIQMVLILFHRLLVEPMKNSDRL